MGSPQTAHSPSLGLSVDLQTDWVPDALGGWNVAPSRTQPEGLWLDISDGDRERTVPVPSIEFRAWASSNSEGELRQLEVNLGPEVFGYRDDTTPYREDFKRYQLALQGLTHHGIPVTLDLKEFFRSVDPKLVADLGLIGPAIRETMAVTQDKFGVSLLHGTRWSRRIGNLILSPLDQELRKFGPHVRWQDDVTAFVESAPRANQLQRSVTTLLGSMGLRLNEEKSGLGLRDKGIVAPFDPFSMTSTGRHAEIVDFLEGRSTQVSRLKLLVRALIRDADPVLIPHAKTLLTFAPGLAPRIAWYLGTLASIPDYEELAVNAISDSLNLRSAWIETRLLAAACYSQVAAERVSQLLASTETPYDLAVGKDLRARCFHAASRPAKARTTRVQEALDAHSWEELKHCLPIIETTL